MKSTSRGWEFLRFIVTGLASTLADYLLCQLVVFLIGTKLDHTWLTVVSTLCGFLLGCVINYLMSTFWVYQNVDKNIKTKSALFIVLFVLFSAIALGLSIGTMLLCNLLVETTMHQSIVELSIIDMFKQYGIGFLSQGIFWAYFGSFCLKTLVGLLFNYFTRKYVLYKEPKKIEE